MSVPALNHFRGKSDEPGFVKPAVKYQVQILAKRGVKPFEFNNHGKPFDTRAEAEAEIEYQKKIDAKPPTGHYEYQIVEVGAG